jgi:hypothetical protein
MLFLSSRFVASDYRLAAVASENELLFFGEVGEPVQALQQTLVDLGYPLPISTAHGYPDGIYGLETLFMVAVFQAQHALTPTGAVDAATLAALLAAAANLPPRPVKPPPPPQTVTLEAWNWNPQVWMQQIPMGEIDLVVANPRPDPKGPQTQTIGIWVWRNGPQGLPPRWGGSSWFWFLDSPWKFKLVLDTTMQPFGSLQGLGKTFDRTQRQNVPIRPWFDKNRSFGIGEFTHPVSQNTVTFNWNVK